MGEEKRGREGMFCHQLYNGMGRHKFEFNINATKFHGCYDICYYNLKLWMIYFEHLKALLDPGL